MKIYISLIILTLSLLLSSCSPSRYCAKHFPAKVDTIIQVDTIWKERLITIEYPADSVTVFIPSKEIDKTQGKTFIKIRKSKQATVKVTKDSTGIRAEAICSEKDSIIKILEAQINTKTTATSVTHIPTKHVPWYLKWAGYWSLVTIPLFLVWLFNKIRKLFMVV